MIDRSYFLRDPIHGFIEISSQEKEILDSTPVQRLRRIKQLGLSYLVYHGAEHSRFGHSLGTMELATQAFDSICRKNPTLFGKKKDRERHRQLLRLCALLHDIGHAPFSHVAEDELMPDLARLTGRKEDSGRKADHEKYSAVIIESELSNLIKKNFSNHSIDSTFITKILSKDPLLKPEERLLGEILSSELDIDRMDYLIRDSRFCGVSYGLFDYDRLIQALTVVEDGGLALAVEEGGQFCIEGLIIGRYHMFLQVYFHHIRRAYDIILNKFLKEQVFVNRTFPSNINKYLAWDDKRVMEMIRKAEGRNDAANRIFHRRHYKMLRQSATACSREEKMLFNLLKNDLASKFGGSAEEFILDEAKNVFSKLRPLEKVEEPEAPTIWIVKRDGKQVPVQASSQIIGKLTEPINLVRLYCHEAVRDQAEKEMKSFWEKANGR